MKNVIYTGMLCVITAFAMTTTLNASLILGLDARDISLSDGAAVAAWTSTTSGGVGSAAQTVGSRQPTFRSSSTPLGGRPGIELDDINDGMTTSVSGLGTTYTVMALYAYRQTTTNASRVVQGGNGTINAGPAAAANNWLIGPYNGVHQLYDGSFINSGSNTTAPVIATALGSPSVNNAFFLNGSLIGSNGNNNAPNFIGIGTEGAWAEPADSDLGLVLVFDNRLTNDERIGVEYHMARAYGLSGYSATTAQLEAGRAQLGSFLIPEPASASLLTFLLGSFAFLRRRRRSLSA